MQLGISLLSYGLFGAWFTALVARWAKGDGYNFLQGLPFRGVPVQVSLALPVDLFEDAEHLRILGGKPGSWRWVIDACITWGLIYPRRWRRERIVTWWQALMATEISHEAEEGALLEIHPDLGMPIEQYPTGGAVLDFCHLRRPPFAGGKSCLGPWRNSISLLAAKTAAVHVQACRVGPELERFLGGLPTELEEMIRVFSPLCSPERVPWVVEIKPHPNPFKARRIARQFGERVRAILEER